VPKVIVTGRLVSVSLGLTTMGAAEMWTSLLRRSGWLGRLRHQCVARAQQAKSWEGNNLTADGIVGPLTWAALPADPQTPTLARRLVRPHECRAFLAIQSRAVPTLSMCVAPPASSTCSWICFQRGSSALSRTATAPGVGALQGRVWRSRFREVTLLRRVGQSGRGRGLHS
jgi:hypothetical protein